MNTDMSIAAAAEPLLLDAALPEFRFSRLECVAIAATPDAVYNAARDLDMLSIHSPLFDAVVWARGVPDRVRRRPVATPPSMRVSDLFDTAGSEDQPWVPLGERAGRELVFGAVGKVWRPTIEWRRVEPGDFAGFEEPGWAKMAAAFVVHPYGAQRSLLTYEARTACTDPESTTRFGRYWTLVSPGVGIVLRGALRVIEKAAETGERIS
ncbi:hypothetical protein [Streptomyces vilmorinianum]|uniref:hypothetical protein n=1 Tax=Streptomyces vilmorinianum TaxID=3051092 RepID=UPI0010FAF197|nr:hypothetical protein [Streptomyces vilmorinianum]